MNETIAQTLAAISGLTTPVARSCHIGNNTSNVWGWLSLAENSSLVQFDHTRYGLDENCMPWLVLGNAGRIVACYNHRGEAQPEWIGRHVTEQLQSIATRYFAILNYSIYADHRGEDLIRWHCQTADRLSAEMNGSRPSFDSAEALSIRSLVRDAVAAFAESQKLHLCIDRWVYLRRRRHSHIVSQAIRRIEYIGASRLEIYDDNGSRAFVGSYNDLSNALINGLEQVEQRLTVGAAVETANYPWFALGFSYLIQAVKEYAADHGQQHFWHAAGSSSQYYINAPLFRQRFAQTRDILVAASLLPEQATVTMIPSYCCQLFATDAFSATALDELLDLWRSYVARNDPVMFSTLHELGKTERPVVLVEQFYKAVDPKLLAALADAAAKFNRLCVNTLPVSHAANLHHPTYNKYGVAQHELFGVTPRFPRALYDLTWGQAELLIKVLAHRWAAVQE
jgi:hypothetical protein